MTDHPSHRSLAEMKEFAGFSSGTQRYIRRSLDVGLRTQDAIALWARNAAEAEDISAQVRTYRLFDVIRMSIPDDLRLDAMAELIGPLVAVSAFDLGREKLPDFRSYRFLYERLIGARVRPWLPSAFCAAAALPDLHPELRGTLLKSLGEADATAAGWTSREPIFFPEWVEKVEVPVAL